MSGAAPETVVCQFQNRAINKFAGPVFRLDAENREPCLFFELDGQPAVVMMHALPTMLAMEEEDEDREMLRLVGLALTFRKVIRPGDTLPSEVVTGEASWTISPHFRLAASTHVTLSLLHWQGGLELLGPLEPAMLTTTDPEIRGKVTHLTEKAARALKVQGTRAVQGLIGELAAELSFVEAGLERLLNGLHRIAGTLRKVGRMAPNITSARRDVGFRTLSLLLTEERRVRAIAAEVAITAGSVEAALLRMAETRAAMRAARDKLFHTIVTWEDELTAWAGPVDVKDERIWTFVERLYRFAARNQVLSAAGTVSG